MSNHVKYLGLCHPSLRLGYKPSAGVVGPCNLEEMVATIWRVRKWRLEWDVTGLSNFSGFLEPVRQDIAPKGNPVESEYELITRHVGSFYDSKVMASFPANLFTAQVHISPQWFFDGVGYYFAVSPLIADAYPHPSGPNNAGERLSIGSIGYGGSSPIPLEVKLPGGTHVADGLYVRATDENYPYPPVPTTVNKFTLEPIEYWPHESVSGLPVFDTETGDILNDSLS